MSINFTTHTYSKFQKSKVIKQLSLAIVEGDVQTANFWTAELICSGLCVEWWNVIIESFAKSIHTANVKITTYLAIRHRHFLARLAEESQTSTNLLWVCNDKALIQTIAEITTIVTTSRKSPSCVKLSVPRSDLSPEQMQARFSAPSCEFAVDVIEDDDPVELFVPLNELAYTLTIDIQSAVYWFEWLLLYEHICKTNGEKLVCHSRIELGVPSKYSKDVVWSVWAVILAESKRSCTSVITRLIEDCLKLYLIDFSPTTMRSRRFLVYFAIKLIRQASSIIISMDVPLFEDKQIIDLMSETAPQLYLQIKSNQLTTTTTTTAQKI